MAEAHQDYHHGDMDVAAHVSSYRLFGSLTKWGSLLAAVIILTLTLWFCTKAGFMGAAFAGLVVAVAGVFFLRDKSTSAH